ncbi:thiamine diphosphate-binding fold superfamily protein [Perilla frutescens var. frutescens]|nr:thiamine diphosphate-binding fold superfamily protein [Perilla frutescens var. frutescens]
MEELPISPADPMENPAKERQVVRRRNSSSDLNMACRTQLPQAAGVAYSLKMDEKEACVVAFTGDGGTSEGDFHVALNFAAAMEASVMFICRRNNGWAISTPISQQFRSDGVVVKRQTYIVIH